MKRLMSATLALLCLLAGSALAQVKELPAGADLDKGLVRGKTTIVEFYADW